MEGKSWKFHHKMPFIVIWGKATIFAFKLREIHFLYQIFA
jgi:hypothetical protein